MNVYSSYGELIGKIFLDQEDPAVKAGRTAPYYWEAISGAETVAAGVSATHDDAVKEIKESYIRMMEDYVAEG